MKAEQALQYMSAALQADSYNAGVKRLIVFLACMVPAWAFIGAFVAMDSAMLGGTVGRAIVGAIVGVAFALILGGVKGKWVDAVFGPEDQAGRNESVQKRVHRRS